MVGEGATHVSWPAIRIGLLILALGWGWPIQAQTQDQADAPKANGEIIKMRHFSGSIGNLHAFVAAKLGFCDKYNFKCELVSINSAQTGVQAVVGGSLDVAQGSIELAAAAVNSGGDIVVAGTSMPRVGLFLVGRSDQAWPHLADGYPAVMADLKGLKIGVPARGAIGEIYMRFMLEEAGQDAAAVTFVGVGGPQTAYTSMAVGRQIDAALTSSPADDLCVVFKTCSMLVNMAQGEGPAFFRLDSAAGSVFVVRRRFADDNPALMAAFYAAMRDAAIWFRDPANLDALVELYKPTIIFEGLPNEDEIRRDWIKQAVGAYSLDLAVNRAGVRAALDFAVAQNLLEKPVTDSQLVWDKAP